MKIMAVIAVLVATAQSAIAAEPTLNDLPSILQKLRGCELTHTLFSLFSNGTTCRIKNADLLVAIDSNGVLTLFRHRPYGDTAYAEGHTVTDLLRNFAAHLNEERETDSAMLKAMAPYLPSQ